MTLPPKIRIGTRESKLARWQSEWVAARLRASCDADVELVPLLTEGDRNQRGPIQAIGTQGVFTKELERALLASEVDVAVHSLKDLPTDQVDGLTLAAVPQREAVADVLICHAANGLAGLPKGAKVGTGSLRRRAQLWHARRDLEMLDIRGNVDTRLAKLREGQFDCIVLAEAGLKRLGLADQITERLDSAVVLPAVGQGALGIQARANDPRVLALLATIEHMASRAGVDAERALLAALRGGCQAPIGAWGRAVESGKLKLDAAVLSPDGRTRLCANAEAAVSEAFKLGEHVAAELLKQGAAELIAASRS